MGMPYSLTVLFLLNLLFQCSFEVPPFSEEVFVVDNLFTSDEIQYMKSLLSQEEALWTYRGQRNVAMDGKVSNEVETATSCFCWSTEIDSETFMGLSGWAKISHTLSARLDVNGEWIVLAHKVRGEVNIRGGQTCSSHSGGNRGGDDAHFTAIIFLVRNWGRNYYGELIVYDNKGEITRAIHPRHGRMVVIPAILEHLIKPPAINIPERLYYLNIHVKLSKVKKSTRKPKAAPTDRSQENIKFPELFPSFNLLTESADGMPREKLDIQKFVTRNFTTSDGHVIVVLDDVLPREELDALSRTVLTSGYSDNPAASDSADNVQWIMSFEVEDFVQKSLWHLISQIVTFVSGREGYYPYDIGCNNIQRGDTTTIHQDCAEDENEFTLLIYLNQNWTENHHGETVFFSDEKGSEVVFAVQPRYGRTLIFHGSIPHSARPPPMTEAVARFTFAVKMAPSKVIALRKSMSLDTEILYEALQNLHGAEAEKLRKALIDIEQGMMDPEAIEELLHHYETNAL